MSHNNQEAFIELLYNNWLYCSIMLGVLLNVDVFFFHTSYRRYVTIAILLLKEMVMLKGVVSFE